MAFLVAWSGTKLLLLTSRSFCLIASCTTRANRKCSLGSTLSAVCDLTGCGPEDSAALANSLPHAVLLMIVAAIRLRYRVIHSCFCAPTGLLNSN